MMERLDAIGGTLASLVGGGTTVHASVELELELI
jgi:hypothetical protein